MRTLVFGGTFDPPHRGHFELLSAAVRTIRPDKILILPAYHAPLKETPTASAAHRQALVRLGVLDRLPPRWRTIGRLDLREARSRRRTYTVETLADLPGELHFVCGQDSAASFPRWKEPSRLKLLASWWYGARPRSGNNIPPHFRRVPGRFPNISSTEIRSALSLGHDCSSELFPEVAAYIRDNKLYGLDILSRLKETLSAGRFQHTLNVASLAEALARRHGLNADAARLAGLLHDMGRRFRPSELASYARRRRVTIPERKKIIAFDPLLLHAHVSEDLARREFGIRDRVVLAAVRRHTLGDRFMGALDRILYVADACSADRAHRDARKIRALAFSDIDAALKECVGGKLTHALVRGAWLHPSTILLWNTLATD
ncbi:MAG: bis(5'-nucleosyl)-tetraphosphatase (symmetrical) YqeK [Elusimicrobiota bacterium]